MVYSSTLTDALRLILLEEVERLRSAIAMYKSKVQMAFKRHFKALSGQL